MRQTRDLASAGGLEGTAPPPVASLDHFFGGDGSGGGEGGGGEASTFDRLFGGVPPAAVPVVSDAPSDGFAATASAYPPGQGLRAAASDAPPSKLSLAPASSGGPSWWRSL